MKKISLVLTGLLLFIIAGLSQSSPTLNTQKILIMWETLSKGNFLISQNGRYYAGLTPDDRLCVFKGEPRLNNIGWCNTTIPNPKKNTRSNLQFSIPLVGEGTIFTKEEGSEPYYWKIQFPGLKSPNDFHAFMAVENDGSLTLFKGVPRGETALFKKKKYDEGNRQDLEVLWSTPPYSSWVLKTNESLLTGEYLTSPNGVYFAVNTPAGNFCVFRGQPTPSASNQVWCALSNPPQSQKFAFMQSDGKLALYNGSGPSNNKGYLWGSSVQQKSGNYFTAMQDDGNLCVYKGTGPADNQGGVWCSQPDGLIALIKRTARQGNATTNLALNKYVTVFPGNGIVPGDLGIGSSCRVAVPSYNPLDWFHQGDEMRCTKWLRQCWKITNTSKQPQIIISARGKGGVMNAWQYLEPGQTLLAKATTYYRIIHCPTCTGKVQRLTKTSVGSIFWKYVLPSRWGNDLAVDVYGPTTGVFEGLTYQGKSCPNSLGLE